MSFIVKRFLALALLLSTLFGAVACSTTREQNGVIIQQQRSWNPLK